MSTDKRRLLYVALLAVSLAGLISFMAKGLVILINLFTHLFFFHEFSLKPVSPASNQCGVWVCIVPALGGLVVGLMAVYGSKGIRGHGIPEAMEQVLTNKSRIRPSLAYLKPLSSAISIGSGGPFGAEGPIIATGGALGSTLGQILKISPHERKILLSAGATAGMSAIFGSPVAGIFLAIELLLFEFSARSIIPVALACVTAAAGHHLFFEAGPVFSMPLVGSPKNTAIASYSCIGLIMGLFATFVTKLVYLVEDGFEILPIHWRWWPALGGLVVGVVGYFAPATLGVGYINITNILSGHMPYAAITALGFMKLLSWAVALGSGTSGGTLAPLLTIGGAMGALLGSLILYLFPESGVSMPVAALVGMASMFAGASRALLTSIVFAIETTGQTNALLPLLASCVGSYCVSFFLMENTIMTEKIARRGIKTPDSFHPDILEKITVQQVLKEGGTMLSSGVTICEAREWLQAEKEEQRNYYIVATVDGDFKGIVSASNLFSLHHSPAATVQSLIKRKSVAVTNDDTAHTAAVLMATENIDVLPVITSTDNKITGIISYRDILGIYRSHAEEHEQMTAISVKRQTLRLLAHGKKRLSFLNEKTK